MKRLFFHFFTAIIVLLGTLLIPARPAAAFSFGEYFSISYSAIFSKTEVEAEEPFTVTISGTAACTKDLELPLGLAREVKVTGRIVARGTATGYNVLLNSEYQLLLSPVPTKAGESVQDSVTLSLVFPTETPPGTYQISGELTKAEVRIPLAGWQDVTDMLPPSKEVGTVKVTGEEIISGGGGGGFFPVFSGGTVSDNLSEIDLRQVYLADYLSQNGSATHNLYLQSESDDCSLFIPEGTVIGLPQGSAISLSVTTVPPSQVSSPPPQSYQLLGTTYRFGPAGATFDPPLQVSFTFDESQIPPGATAGSLRIAWYNETTDSWEELASTVDTATSTVTARLSHFSMYSVVARIAPAEFEVSNLEIEPNEFSTGDNCTVTAHITNIGDITGTYNIQLLLDNRIIHTEMMELEGQSSRGIEYYLSVDKAGTHIVSLGGQSVSITVIDPQQEEPAQPEPEEEEISEPTVVVTVPSPASFNLEHISLDRSVIRTGETLKVVVTVTNTGNQAGTRNLAVVVDGIIEDSQSVTLAGGETQQITFTITGSRPGEHELTTGDLKATFTVKASVDIIQYAIYGGILILAVLAAVITSVLLIKRRKRRRISQKESE